MRVDTTGRDTISRGGDAPLGAPPNRLAREGLTGNSPRTGARSVSR
jgi:hypothetical protein